MKTFISQAITQNVDLTSRLIKPFVITLLVSLICSFSNAQILVNSSGKVGVNNSSPTKQLDVVGDAKISGTLNIDSIIVPQNPINQISSLAFSGGYANDIIFGVDDNNEFGIMPSSELYGSIGTSDKKFYSINVSQISAEDITTYYFTLTSSDKRKKENINSIKNALDVITQMEGKKFDFKTEKYDSIKNEKKKKRLIERSKNHAGFLAQDLEYVLPEAVIYDKENDAYYLDYSAIIPYLVEAIKEQQSQIETLTTMMNSTYTTPNKVVASNSFDISTNETTSLIEQNAPNPFTTETMINYYLPLSANSASIYIYDMNGRQLKSYQISVKGSGYIVINGSELTAGMYLYALVVDNLLIDTKRMLLTN